MRTTLVLDDDLVQRAKYRAAELKLTVSDVVNQALRKELAEEPSTAPPFRMLTYRGGRERVHHEPPDFSATSDDEANLRESSR